MREIRTGWRWKLIFSLICLAGTAILQILARKVDGFAEFYAVHVYPLWVNSIGRFMSVFPVSVSEVLLYLMILCMLFSVLRLIFFSRGCRGRKIGRGCMTLIALASALCLVYTLNCGINYHRRTFSQVEEFEVREHTVDELYALCLRLTDDVNSYSGQILRNKHGLCVIDTDMNARAAQAMTKLGKSYTSLSGYYPNPKKLMISG